MDRQASFEDQSHAESRQKCAFSDSWLAGEKSDVLGFVDFGQLSSIILEKWKHFEALIPSQHWLKNGWTNWRKQDPSSPTIGFLFSERVSPNLMYIAIRGRRVSVGPTGGSCGRQNAMLLAIS